MNFPIHMMGSRAIAGDTTLFRVNCGGSAVTATDGEMDWIADTNSSPCIYTNANGANGETSVNSNSYITGASSGSFVASTGYAPPSYASSSDLYKSERYGGAVTGSDSNTMQFNYVFPVTNGDYTVNLGLAEIYQTNTSARKFHVEVNGVKKFDNVDCVAKYGGRYYMGWESFPITVSTSEIRINYNDGFYDGPKASIIEIIQH
mgnify:CR=1 FL=1